MNPVEGAARFLCAFDLDNRDEGPAWETLVALDAQGTVTFFGPDRATGRWTKRDVKAPALPSAPAQVIAVDYDHEGDVDLVCAGAFLWQTRDAFGAAIAVWWAGQNLIDLAPYINDARDLQLVLLGGRTGAEVEGHDWEYLLNAMRLSHYDHAIAAVVQTVGNVTMILALAWALIIVVNQLSVLRGQST